MQGMFTWQTLKTSWNAGFSITTTKNSGTFGLLIFDGGYFQNDFIFIMFYHLLFLHIIKIKVSVI